MSEGMQEGRNAVLIDDKDNVVIAIYPLKAGDEVRYPAHEGGLATFVATEDIPLFHKIARVDIAAGQNVVKYGEFIGVATSDIKRGQHVHTQNCESSDAFYLAIPVMFGASGLRLVKFFLKGNAFAAGETAILLAGCVVAFVVSLIVIRFLMSFIRKHDFKPFGWYRIVLGVVVIVYFALLA